MKKKNSKGPSHDNYNEVMERRNRDERRMDIGRLKNAFVVGGAFK